MLHERLERESRTARRNQARFAVILAACALLVAAFVVVLIVVGPELRNRAGEEPVAAAPAPAGEEEASRPGSVPDAEPPSAADPPPAPESGPEPDALSEADADPAHDAADAGPESDGADADSAREEFKEALAAFRDEIEPAVADPGFGRWNASAQRRILDGRDAAVARFAEGDHGEAIDALAAAAEAARRELGARDAAFEAALAGAGAAYEADDHATASRDIAQALDIRPDSAPAQDLAARIDDLPALLSEIESAAVARVENNPHAEERHLAAALALDPGRAELEARLGAVRGALRESRFTAAVDAGLEAVRTRDPAAARRHLDEAQALDPGRAETELLAKQADALDLALETERLTAEARRAEAADDWPAAEAVWGQAQALAPDHAAVAAGMDRALAINDLRGRVDRHLAAPHRLADGVVADEVRQLLGEAAAWSGDSPSLAGRTDELAGLLDGYAVKVPVRVISDGETHIRVRGVGVVGATTDRTIELHPGVYTFEGVREGFRSELVRVEIPPGAAGIVVEVIPDERI